MLKFYILCSKYPPSARTHDFSSARRGFLFFFLYNKLHLCVLPDSGD